MSILSRAVGTALCACVVAAAAHASDLTVSQFRVRGPAGGNDEFIELHNSGANAVDLSGYKLEGSNNSGTTGTRATLPAGASIGPGCYYLLANKNAYSGSVGADLIYSTGITDTGGVALVDASGNMVDQVGLSTGSAFGEGTRLDSLGSSNKDQAYQRKTDAAGLSVDSDDNASDFSLITPSAPHDAASQCTSLGLSVSVADAAVDEGDSGNTALTFTLKLTQPAPVGTQVHVATADDTATVADGDYDALDTTITFPTGATEATVTVNVHGDTTVEPDEDFTLTLSQPSAGLSIGRAQAIGGILNDDAALVEIWQIQGSGDASPLVGQPVRTEDNIVTGVGAAGFTMQTPDPRSDNNPLTSDGVYVYTGAKPSVSMGDAVDVKGRVDEYYGFTEITDAKISVTASGQALPKPVVFDRHTPSMDPAHLSCGDTNFECFESMRVAITRGIVDRGNQRYSGDDYAEVFASAGGIRSLRSKGVPYGDQPSDVNSGVWDGNPEVFEMDADYFGAVPNGTGINGGARFKAVGVIGYDYGDYEFWPTSLKITYDNPMPRPVSDAAGDASVLRVGNLNMLRLCDTDPSNSTYTCGDNGEPDAAELAVKLSRLSAYIGGVLKLPDVLAAEEVEDLTVLQGLATQLNNDYGTHYEAYLVDGHDPSGIDVGYLVRSHRVHVSHVEQLGGDETWIDPSTGQSAFLQDRPPLLLEGRKLGAHSFAFRLLAVHPKSRIGVDSGSSATRNREKRFEQAKQTAQIIQQLQTQKGKQLEPLVVLGDFNAYPFTDGWVDVVGAMAGTYDDSENLLDLGGNIVKPSMWNAVQSVPRNDRYSFLYTEQLGAIQGYQSAGSRDTGRDVPVAQVLDQALLSRAALPYFRSFQYGRGDLDAPDQVQADAVNYTGVRKAIGVSDHDGFVMDLAAPTPRSILKGIFDRLKHKAQQHGHGHH
ncbi:lamin tail domain-containing protein [Oleiagrimonas sp. C23AA]|uniref:lamin tail domain-containing protein n=1 Tax=Oleiagrimonas sp. C23AA TaxID=2719047 RepID=UPI0014232016|nr:lamin tail domain-containing protein [Oleiagrimonas sp. C23AA]NII09122.1 hypothetical protein [Oleiagrimonas sp. C23AA]